MASACPDYFELASDSDFDEEDSQEYLNENKKFVVYGSSIVPSDPSIASDSDEESIDWETKCFQTELLLIKSKEEYKELD